MKIHEAKASSYDSVNSEYIVDYIGEYATQIYNAYNNNKAKLATKDRTQLKAIAASLETICKRLDAMEGKY